MLSRVALTGTIETEAAKADGWIVRFLVNDFSLGIGGKSHYLAKTDLLWGA
ncbi:hypothetical protein EMIHUDRAFT_211475 [Emiliania huxleyi CCMP1516]|uniref:Uncharacterized protein n=2 Tax=Emiliania huxleyi TaxID=2903 RepID=A0A0D3IVN6_EMIH1|nr:hypothetical protein EMIHUDRAFT_211475 [Emiliania huxleyi CCMP1516]EOD15321.1 hypothetical protein EMIHUDRAFT_211475 [Emiliania huxleyi CCMP1516]|eukprot:XP_005767750.1 hypothetical protein EMIHUDRAFT_211475 [Emiliania huxleyi CCMP1516]